MNYPSAFRPLVLVAALAALPAFADATPEQAAPDYTLTSNVYLTSDYYFRGITQTWHKPAIQGGVDFSHSSGLYAGIWGSNVSNSSYPGGHGYLYPGANYNKAATPGADQSFDSFEVNAGLSWRFISVKYSYFLTDWFGGNQNTYPGSYSGSSEHTSYLEANVAYEIVPTWTLNLHAGQTSVQGLAAGGVNPGYSDYLIGMTKGFDGGWTAQLGYVKSSYKDSAFYKPTVSFANSDKVSDPGDGRLILTVGRVF